MPPEDLFIKELLLTAYHHHRGKTPPRIDAVQFKRDRTGDRFHHYFGGKATFRSYYGGLESYVTQPSTVFDDAITHKL